MNELFKYDDDIFNDIELDLSNNFYSEDDFDNFKNNSNQDSSINNQDNSQTEQNDCENTNVNDNQNEEDLIDEEIKEILSRSNFLDEYSKSKKERNIDTCSKKIIKAMKKLVEVSYDEEEQGYNRYNNQLVSVHYYTHQKHKIVDDKVSPIIKSNVYYFDLSPSNDFHIQLYCDALASICEVGSTIYTGFNTSINQKIDIKRKPNTNIEMKKISNLKPGNYLFYDVEGLTDSYVSYDTNNYVEVLTKEQDRKIFVFSDFDVLDEMIEVSNIVPNIVWFCTSYNNYKLSLAKSKFNGYFVETDDEQDIIKYVKCINKEKYRRRK